MDEDARTKLAELTQEVEAVRASIDKLLWYFRVTMYVTIAVIVIPLVLMVFAIPFAMNTLTSSYSSLGL